MKIKIPFLFIFVALNAFFLISPRPALACIDPPYVMGGPLCNLHFDDKELADLKLIEKKLQENASQCGFAKEALPIIRDYVANGYSAVVQSDKGYAQFLSEAKTKNQDRPKECPAYQAVSHKSGWTGIIATGQDYSKETGCQMEKCTAVKFKVVWSDL